MKRMLMAIMAVAVAVTFTAPTFAEEKKKAVNPFGRLVNMEELDSRSAEKSLRQLTPQERFDDRNEVHRIVKECEQSAIVMLNTLRDRIGPALTRINHSLSGRRSVHADAGK